jgi:hypothetical protein
MEDEEGRREGEKEGGKEGGIFSHTPTLFDF